MSSYSKTGQTKMASHSILSSSETRSKTLMSNDTTAQYDMTGWRNIFLQALGRYRNTLPNGYGRTIMSGLIWPSVAYPNSKTGVSCMNSTFNLGYKWGDYRG